MFGECVKYIITLGDNVALIYYLLLLQRSKIMTEEVEVNNKFVETSRVICVLILINTTKEVSYQY